MQWRWKHVGMESWCLLGAHRAARASHHCMQLQLHSHCCKTLSTRELHFLPFAFLPNVPHSSGVKSSATKKEKMNIQNAWNGANRKFVLCGHTEPSEVLQSKSLYPQLCCGLHQDSMVSSLGLIQNGLRPEGRLHWFTEEESKTWPKSWNGAVRCFIFSKCPKEQWEQLPYGGIPHSSPGSWVHGSMHGTGLPAAALCQQLSLSESIHPSLSW